MTMINPQLTGQPEPEPAQVEGENQDVVSMVEVACRDDAAGSIVLRSDDPFDAALIPIVETNRRKRRDYARDESPFSNFDATAESFGMEGFGRKEAVLFNILQKLARIKALRANGRLDDTSNETVADTYLDLAVYSCILYAMSQEESAE